MSCTNDVYSLFRGEIAFVLNHNPHWDNLFILYPLNEISQIEFFGHFFMFFILTGLLNTVFKRISIAIILAFLYGFAIELLQPFFNRGAEGVDVLANAMGIALFVILYAIRKARYGIKYGKVASKGKEQI